MARTIRQRLRLPIALLAFCPLATAQADYLDIWSTQIGSLANDYVQGIATGPGGSSYVGGYTFGDLFESNVGVPDGFVARYDDGGTLLWSRSLATPLNDVVFDVAPDGQGGVLVAGRTEGDLSGTVNGLADAFVARYDSAGTQLWIQQFGSFNFDAATGLLADGTGGAFVLAATLGSVAGTSAGNTDIVIRRIDASGTTLWTQQYGTQGQDDAGAIAADGTGGIYVTGTTSADFGGPSQGAQDAYLVHYDGFGNLLWSTQFGSSGADAARALIVLGSDQIYVGGSTTGDLYGPVNQLIAGFVARIDDDGNEIWGERLMSPRIHAVVSLVPAPNGGVLAFGTEAENPGGTTLGPGDLFLTGFDPQGMQGSPQYIGTPEAENAGDLALGSNGQLLVAGRTEGDLAGSNAGGFDIFLMQLEAQVGTAYCAPTVPNSTGLPARIRATGSTLVSDNVLRLQAVDMPLQQFGYFVTSQTQGFTPGAGGSQGNLCLGGAIGRYVTPGQVQNSGSDGRIDLALDLTQTPTPLGTVPVLSGQTWNFQAWFRDVNPLPTSNFTDGVTVSF